MQLTQEWIPVSHGIGVPFGAIGTGYGVLGKYGFVMPNFDSFPGRGKYASFGAPEAYDYLAPHGKDRENFLRLVLEADGRDYCFQKEMPEQAGGIAADSFESWAFLPFSLHRAAFGGGRLRMEMLAYTPLLPHNLRESTTPVLCMELTVRNQTGHTLAVALRWELPAREDGLAAVFQSGQDSERFCLAPGESGRATAFLGWYYPDFTTPSPMMPGVFRRRYALYFGSAREVCGYAASRHSGWKEGMLQWQRNLGVPAPFKRLWFSSLASVITSTMLSADPYFLEIETPHPWINTMDVSVYSGWVYLVNWPELEKMDLYQYRQSISAQGETRGLVWHSLWNDEADYVEEPCFIARIYRDYLWNNDREFLQNMAEPAALALERAYGRNAHEGLIASRHGNQSYDAWKMPGISAYVNLQWLYALHAADKIHQAAGTEFRVRGRSAADILEQASRNFQKYLWNGEKGYFHCFYRTADADAASVPESVFTDHLFGRWLLLIEKDPPRLLPAERVRSSARFAYRNNRIDDPERGFRGWANGKLPDGTPCCDGTQYHAKTCWLGAQLDLASVLGELGDEAAALDMFYALEKSLHNNHLAVGEWNKAATPEGKSALLAEERAKDTPRFPPYPRYKSCWEWLVRLLGLKVSETEMELAPFRSFDFFVRETVLAGCRLTVEVRKGWHTIHVDGEKREKAVFDRRGAHEIVFQ